eukprot:COSAG01_NODE_2137_length_8329_cov_52.487242_4_plen_62_part_00
MAGVELVRLVEQNRAAVAAAAAAAVAAEPRQRDDRAVAGAPLRTIDATSRRLIMIIIYVCV